MSHATAQKEKSILAPDHLADEHSHRQRVTLPVRTLQYPSPLGKVLAAAAISVLISIRCPRTGNRQGGQAAELAQKACGCCCV
eukprot:CAMPEP_0171093160 /NCGR_PEP_ID=MMETSP0766_2-20121228/38918_1 /TAXON_ID=439317 /ORGANISM="Gambierdiscus australes, Strain CAWD 149" /LENGTH=82 /DNA_ID=CAMNT_0011551557 /DNA_START=97 /DNA_END=342 /DNA_ORIENTATION=+